MQGLMQRSLKVGCLRRPPLIFGLTLLIYFGSAGWRPAAAQDVDGLQAALAIQQAMVESIEKAEKSVVAIARVRRGRPAFAFAEEDDPTSPDFVPDSYGTGVVVGREGLILTNYHVIGDPDRFDVYVWVNRTAHRVTDVEKVERVNAADPWTDLAVLKINADDLQPIEFGDADSLKKGMLVIALGNPHAIARDGQASASWGIVSNLSRTAPRREDATPSEDTLHHYGTLIQTDIRLPRGTSGGPLLNLQGQMVGLTTSLAALSGHEQTTGFAVPVDDTFRRVLDDLKAGRSPSFGFLGVEPDNRRETDRRQGRFGAVIRRVISNTPAHQAGLRSGDVITHINGVKIYDRNELFRELSRLPAEANVRVTWELGMSTGYDSDYGGRTGFAPRIGGPVTREIVLSKKYIASRRPVYTSQPPRQWRGMQVEYPSALPTPQFLERRLTLGDRRRSVGVLSVEHDSAAWKAGFRSGDFITHVDEQAVGTPGEFYEAVENLTGTVELRGIDGTGRQVSRPVEPADESAN